VHSSRCALFVCSVFRFRSFMPRGPGPVGYDSCYRKGAREIARLARFLRCFAHFFRWEERHSKSRCSPPAMGSETVQAFMRKTASRSSAFHRKELHSGWTSFRGGGQRDRAQNHLQRCGIRNREPEVSDCNDWSGREDLNLRPPGPEL